MKIAINCFSITILSIFILASCGDINDKVENKLKKLQDKAESLDSLINIEVDKVLTLDSLINTESDRIKELDSLINKTSSKLDSIASEKIEKFENIVK